MKNNFYLRYCGVQFISMLVMMAMITIPTAFYNTPLPAFLKILAFILSIYLPASMFASDHRRIPDKSEKKRFGRGVFAAWTALALVLSLLILPAMPPETRATIAETSALMWVVILILSIGITYVLYALFAGWLFGLCAKISLGKSGGR